MSRTGWRSASGPLRWRMPVIILCALMLFWHAGDPGTALAEYAQSALAGYEVFF